MAVRITKRCLLLIALTLVAVLGCGNVPIFDEMATNRLTVIIKGTYESNNPRGWDAWNSTNFPLDDSVVYDVAHATPGSVVPFPTTFMFDIAEMRIGDDGSDDKFAFYRRTFRIPLTDSEPFFNGTGIIYRNDDPSSNFLYTRVLMYIRKMIFDGATRYQFAYSDPDPAAAANWVFQETNDTIFDESTVLGFDFNQLQYNTFWDTLREEASSTNRVFPLEIPIDGGLIFDNSQGETVLEIRLVVQNFIKQFEQIYTDSDGYRQLIHYWGLSDWLRDVQADEKVVGGNVLAVARSYVVGKTVTLTGSATAGRYVIAIESNSIGNYAIANRSRPSAANTPPTAPHIVDINNVDSILDYYLRYEKYKEAYNNFITSSVNTGTYGNVWDDYESRITSFRLPPLATYSNGTYTLTNVPVGKTYYIYEATSATSSGAIPDAFSLIKTITVSESQAGQTITVP